MKDVRRRSLIAIALIGTLPAIGGSWTFDAANGGSFKELLLKAAPHDTIHVTGTIAEGTITISQPLVLIGNEGAVIDGGNAGEVLLIKADDVTVKGFTVRGTRVSNLDDNAGIKAIGAQRTVIIDNFMDRCFFAIYLSGTQGALVENNTIIGDDSIEERMANGIHLWKCSNVTIRNNHIERHRDGIYFEFVTDSHIEHNTAEHCIRYGLHFMFSHRNTYAHNRFKDNGAGVAVMYSKEISMHGNQFITNRGASAYGLLLKEINDGEIHGNFFTDNTTGIMLDGCNRIEVKENIFRSNGYALRLFANALNCNFEGNIFSGNTFDMSTNGTLQANELNGNYWDRYSGYDLDRDGHGDVPHRPLGFFTLLVEQQPYAMVFSRSLFVTLLDRAERTIPSLSPASLMDERPLMRAPQHETSQAGVASRGKGTER